MKTYISRRRLLASSAALAIAGPALTSLQGLGVFAVEPQAAEPDKVRFGTDIEPIVRLIEETPREKCVEMLVEQLRKGLPYRRFLAATFFVSIRRLNSNHDVYKISAVHQVCNEVRPEERLLPLFWTVDTYKQHQQDFPNGPLRELQGVMPSAASAAAELEAAFVGGDVDAAERAVVVLARNEGFRPALDRLWQYGCRNGLAGGHAAIVVTSCYRALETIGWQHAEPVLRFVLRDIYNLGGNGKPDRYYQPNTVRADRQLDKLPSAWTGGGGDKGATLEVFAPLRAGKANEACDLAIEQLQRGVAAQAIWDAVHLATAEMMVRHNDGWGLASRPLHSNTCVSALHYAFDASSSPRTRLLSLLQAVAWAGDKTSSELGLKSLREITITDLPRAELPAKNEDAVAEVFALLPERHYRWDAKEKKAILVYGSRTDADEACHKVFALAAQRRDAVPLYMQAAQGWLCQKATSDSHDYKFLAAILEDAQWVSPSWQPHILAASVHYTHGRQSIDHPVVVQAREALKSV